MEYRLPDRYLQSATKSLRLPLRLRKPNISEVCGCDEVKRLAIGPLCITPSHRIINNADDAGNRETEAKSDNEASRHVVVKRKT